MDKNELKIQALREQFKTRLSNTTDELENAIADLRVEYTQLSEQLKKTTEELAKFKRAMQEDVQENQEEPSL